MMAMSSRLTKTSAITLYVTLPFGTIPSAFECAFAPNHRKMICGIATNRPSTDTNFACSLALRRKRNSSRSSNTPTSGDTMPTAMRIAEPHRQSVRDVRVVVDRGREERLRTEREVEHPRRPVRQHEPDGKERVDAAETESAKD